MKKILFLLFIIICSLSVVRAVEPDPTLIVNIASFEPCVIIGDNKSPTGFDVEIWEAIAEQLGLKYKYLISSSHLEVLENIKQGKADVGISGITITNERENYVDFSHHYMDSGLRIVILKSEATFIDKILLFWTAMKIPFLVFILFLFVFSHIIWFLERDKDPANDANSFNDNYFPGIWEAFYYCMVTISTVGYGDYTCKKWRGRIITIVLIVVGIISFCNFTALLSSAYTIKDMGRIKSPEDLKGKIVLTQGGTTSIDYLKSVGAIIKNVPTEQEAYNGLLLKEGDAVVFDSPSVLNYVQNNSDKVVTVGGLFAKQYYGFALQKNSRITKELNQALLKLRETKKYDLIYNKWFGKTTGIN